MAKPERLPDGSVNLMVWRCTIPGKQGVNSRLFSLFPLFVISFFFFITSEVLEFLFLCYLDYMLRLYKSHRIREEHLRFETRFVKSTNHIQMD